MSSFVYWGFNKHEDASKKTEVEVINDDLWIVVINDNVAGYVTSRKDAEAYVKSVSMKLVGKECTPTERFMVEENSTEDMYENVILSFNKILLIAFETTKHIIRTYRITKLNQPLETNSEENSE